MRNSLQSGRLVIMPWEDMADQNAFLPKFRLSFSTGALNIHLTVSSLCGEMGNFLTDFSDPADGKIWPTGIKIRQEIPIFQHRDEAARLMFQR